MVTPALCAPSEVGSRRYSRACPPYPFTYPDRRFHLSSQDNRPIIMTDRDDSDQPRKRIAVATDSGMTLKSAGDAVSARFGAVAIRETAGRAPIVSSQEAQMKDGGDYTYNLDAARTYAHQTRGAVSSLSTLPQYAQEITTGDGLAPYRQSSYPYTGKGYHPNMSGWTSTYADDGNVDYGIGYSSYPIVNQDATSLVPAYGHHQYGTRKSVYVDPETPPYSYGNLVHRPSVHNDSQGFSLSSIAASLPNSSERILSSDRLHSSVNRTLTNPSSSYQSDGTTAYSYTSSTSKAPSSNAISDVAYGNLQPSFEGIYPRSTAISSSQTHRSPGNAEASTYPPSASTTSQPQLYASNDQAIRSTEDGSTGFSYIYTNNKLGNSRRDSHSGGGGVSAAPLLSNGHVYVPDSHAANATLPYMGGGRGLHGATSVSAVGHGGEGSSVPVPVSMTSTNRVSGGSGTSTSTVTGTGTSSNGNGNGNGNGTSGGGSSHRPSDNHRRSAGSLRGI
ncbi:hypothetical protein GGR50DRAFT_687812 [Xylaria sp. CBS 124048]|nr:hypothetical protein GGR50DRAFT_687812 [Xylaria sp. CBS 124048]